MGGTDGLTLNEIKKGISGQDGCCHLCKHPFREPYAGRCGHASCKSCLAVLFTRNLPDVGNVLCNICGSALSLHELKPDPVATRKLQKYKNCRCRNCNWKGTYIQYIENHERVCGGIIRVQCKVLGCEKWLPKDKALELHRSDDWCPMILLMKTRLTHAEIVHLSMRESWEWTCGLVLKSDKQSVRQYMERLVQVFSALDPSVPVALDNDEYAATRTGGSDEVRNGACDQSASVASKEGTSETSSKEKDIAIEREAAGISDLPNDYTTYLPKSISLKDVLVTPGVPRVLPLPKDDQDRKFSSQPQEHIELFNRRVHHFEREFMKMKKDVDAALRRLEDLRNMPKAFAALDEKHGVFEGVMATLNNEIITLGKRMDHLKLPSMLADTSILEKLVKANQDINRSITSLAQSLQKLDTRLLEVETSHTGVFLWRIVNYSQKKQEAKTTSIKSIYSAPFFTSQYGYKLCGRVFLMGDGVGKGTHISLFLTIMKGPYDAVLSWPFKDKITFQLVNQSDPLNKSITEAFRPDPASSSFKRPTSERNIGAGCPLFAKLQVIEDMQQGFIVDDTLFIKLTSQTSDVPEYK